MYSEAAQFKKNADARASKGPPSGSQLHYHEVEQSYQYSLSHLIWLAPRASWLILP